jgi:hypothetical protein
MMGAANRGVARGAMVATAMVSAVSPATRVRCVGATSGFGGLPRGIERAGFTTIVASRP